MDIDTLAALVASGVDAQHAGDLEGALAIATQVTEVAPDAVAGWVNKAVAEQALNVREGGAFAGRESLERAIALRRMPQFLNDYANCIMYDDRRYDDAMALYREAAIRFRSPTAAFHLAVCLMIRANETNAPDDWWQAWAWNEWRPQKRELGDLEYRGEPIDGKTITVLFEQGLGDQVWGLRFLRDLHRRGARVNVLCSAPMMRICSRQPYIARVFDEKDDIQVQTDFVVQLMSLPQYCLPDCLPQAEDGYIGVPPRVGDTALRIGRPPRIGLAWHGSVDRSYQGWRNVPPAMLRPVIEARPDAEWISLQFADGDAGLPISTESIDECRDVLDVAQVMRDLDLIISVDTVTAHLGAAIGRPVLLMDRWSSAWPWLPQGSRWYDNVKTIRQVTHRDWQPVIAAVAAHVRDL